MPESMPLAAILFTLSVPLWGRLSACARPSGLAEAGLKAGCGLKGRPTQLGQLSKPYCLKAALLSAGSQLQLPLVLLHEGAEFVCAVEEATPGKLTTTRQVVEIPWQPLPQTARQVV